MPDLDGFEVLERMKADPDLRHIPVIMISGLEDIESVVRCIEMGAEDFLPKPFDPVILRARVNAGLDRVRLHELERDHVRGVFARFLPESVVDEALERSDGEPRLGGERMTGTVMFTDLRELHDLRRVHPGRAGDRRAEPLLRRHGRRPCSTTAARWSPTRATACWRRSAPRSRPTTTRTARSRPRPRWSASGSPRSTAGSRPRA